jgi:DNA polymerase-1
VIDLSQIQVEFVDSTEKAFEFLRWISDVRTPVMSVDVETDGFDWYDGRLKLVQFGSLTQGWAVPFAWFSRLVQEALDILTRRRMPLVGHNFRFDLHFLDRNLAWTPTLWGLYHDTWPLSSVIESTGSKALKDLSEEKVTPYAKVGQKRLHDDMKRGGWDWGTVPVTLESYWLYGVLDTIFNANLFAILMHEAQGKGVMDAYDVERGCFPALYLIEKRGILVDGEHCQTQLTELRAAMARLTVQAYDEYGIESIGSKDQLVRAFLDNGVTLTKKTPKGRYQLDKKAFEELELREGMNPLVALVSEYRKAEKYTSSYYENFLRFQRSDGRVHPSYRQTQARTGRMSAVEPAIQTLPRPKDDDFARIKNDWPQQVRNSFVAADGYSLISTDFTNVEARIFAHFAQETGLLQAIRDGHDLHGYTAQQVYHEWDDTGFAPKDHPKRQIAKNVLFCMLFGGGAEKVAVTAHTDIDTAVAAFQGTHRAFPGIKRFQKQTERQARENMQDTGRAWVRGLDGRILMLNENDDRFYAFTNYLIQGTATILLKQRLAAIHNLGLSEYCVAAIHDEVVSEVPEGDAVEYVHQIEDAMRDDHQFSVPIVAESGHPTKRLGDAK